ncbi:hypothetical protein EJ06DRAFT_344884 [Trichodelitschia bisporula]|uniref:Uncharacterized protein n=1 Tax=Trichodelitschia bisporula TaxID=703511 RepID=A0A6G1I2Q6_9PEZI|nr:hypothetical protein EJ06DRAFT_344884 [Trichodelitschia bisporula]
MGILPGAMMQRDCCCAEGRGEAALGARQLVRSALIALSLESGDAWEAWRPVDGTWDCRSSDRAEGTVFGRRKSDDAFDDIAACAPRPRGTGTYGTAAIDVRRYQTCRPGVYVTLSTERTRWSACRGRCQPRARRASCARKRAPMRGPIPFTGPRPHHLVCRRQTSSGLSSCLQNASARRLLESTLTLHPQTAPPALLHAARPHAHWSNTRAPTPPPNQTRPRPEAEGPHQPPARRDRCGVPVIRGGMAS